MSKKKDSMYTCEDCSEWERMVINRALGVCLNPQSDHYCHVVKDAHSPCRKICRHTYRSRKCANYDWQVRKQEAERAVKPLPPPDIGEKVG